ncbi:MAG: cytidine deaminase [candidate division Zixibacteria bacterium]|nr:cytidine deaminase [candidate division Zixibacteria bacterium]
MISNEHRELISAAREALENAYAPYSNFRVGAALLGGNGLIYSGCNVENASYGLTICAERNAIFKMISDGEREIKAIAVVVEGNRVVTPCGACRQVIREFARDDCPVICLSSGAREDYQFIELLPRSFSEVDLK